MTFSADQVEAAYVKFSQNWGDVQNCDVAVCSVCLAKFAASDVTEIERDEGEGMTRKQSVLDARPTDTVRCPACDLPYVICEAAGLPVRIDDYLAAVRKRWHNLDA